MARTTSVTIGDQLDSFMTELIDSGRYGSVSEVIRSALRLLAQQENYDEIVRLAVSPALDKVESPLLFQGDCSRKEVESQCICLCSELHKTSAKYMIIRL